MKLAFCLPVLLVAACGGGLDNNIGHKDHGDDTPNDLSVDSSPGDMAQPLVGDGGRQWTDESYTGYDAGSLSGVWNDGAGNVIAVGDYGKILRSQQGGTFTVDPSTNPANAASPPGLTAVYGLAGPDVFIVGLGSALWKWGGGALSSTGVWNPDVPGTGNDLYAVWAPTDGVAFAGGTGIILERIPDTAASANWTPVTSGQVPASTEFVLGIWAVLTGPSQYDVFAVGCLPNGSGQCMTPRIWHYQNGTVTKETVPGSLSGVYGVWGSGTTDIYAVGDSGTVLHTTGNGTWTKQSTPTTDYSLDAIGGSGPDEIYATGYHDSNGTLFFSKHDHNSTQWTREVVAPAKGRDFYSISVTPTDIYMVGEGGAILHK